MTAAVEYNWHADAWRLMNAAITRGAHALLLTGARGLGKRSLAIRLAAYYLCGSRSAEGGPCGSCESCRWLAAGTHPDFALVEPLADENNTEAAAIQNTGARGRPIGVDQIRQLGELLALTAHRDAGKVVVIHPAESMNAQAANALLKNLEEPPARTAFILVSHRPASLPPTIRSRCQSVPVKLDDWGAAESWLAAQGVANAAELLALCGGAPLEAAGIVSDPVWERRRDFLGSMCEEGADGVALAEKFRELPPGTMLSWLQKWTFDLLLMHSCGHTRYHRDMSAVAGKFVRALDPASLVRLHRRLLAMQRHIHHPLNPRLLTEQMLLDCRQVFAGVNGRAA